MNLLSFFSTYKIKCPDGTVRIINRNIDDAFPLYIKGNHTKTNIDVNAIDEIKGKVSVDVATKILGLIYGLDELNSGIMMHFRAAYIAFQSDPCGKADYFERQVATIIKDQNRLITIKVQIAGLISLAKEQPQNTKELLDLYGIVVRQMGGEIMIADAATAEIIETRKLAVEEAGRL